MFPRQFEPDFSIETSQVPEIEQEYRGVYCREYGCLYNIKEVPEDRVNLESTVLDMAGRYANKTCYLSVTSTLFQF